MPDVSPTLRVIALAALPDSSRRLRRAILRGIRNTSGLLVDQPLVELANRALADARNRANVIAEELFRRKMGAIESSPYARRSMARRHDQRMMSDWEGNLAYAKTAVDLLNDRLRSVGRLEVSIPTLGAGIRSALKRILCRNRR